MRDYGHSHYVANADQYKERANLRLSSLRTENRKLVKDYLLTNPCGKCQESNPKVLTISVTSAEINNLATPALQARLAVSSVLCRNCQASQD